jgi:hypothetical protein
MTGTAMFAIRTPDTFVIASDSTASLHGARQPLAESVRKIFAVDGFIYGVSGVVQDKGRGFDLRFAIQASLEAGGKSLLQAGKALEDELPETFGRELESLRREAPDHFESAAKVGSRFILARWEEDRPVALAVGMWGRLNAAGDIQVETRRLACPGKDCPGGTLVFRLGHHEAADRLMHQGGVLLGKTPLDAAVSYVRSEIQAGSPGVGPPVQAACMSAAGVAWLSKPA